jgi:hypothetical protein
MQNFLPKKKHYYFLLYLMLLFPFLFGIAYLIGFNKSASAAITVGSNSAPPAARILGPLSWQHTTNAGNNRLLIVGVHSVGLPPSSVTYNNTNLTSFPAQPANTGSIQIWYLKNPPTGTYTVRINGIGSSIFTGGATTFNNVDQNNTFGTMAISSGVTSPNPILPKPSVSISSTNTQVIYDIIGFTAAASSMLPNSGQTAQWISNFDPQFAAAGSIKQGQSGTTTLGWQLTGSSAIWSMVAIPINSAPNPNPTPTPVPTATPVPPTLIPTATPTPIPQATNIINLNFGINNLQPWIQSVCGNIRNDQGFINMLPVGQYASVTNASCTEPGIIYTGDSAASFGQGQASTTNRIVGGNIYSETYDPQNGSELFSSYATLNAKAQSLDTPPVNLSTICILSNCTLPANLPSGIYQASSDVTLNAVTFLPNRDYVFLINGSVTIQGNVITPVTSSAVYAASGNIIVSSNVGSPANITTANLSGIFSADNSFIMNSNNNCTDLRLNVEGTIIANAARDGGNLINNRDLCAANNTTPALRITHRLDFIVNLPEFIRLQQTQFDEVAP